MLKARAMTLANTETTFRPVAAPRGVTGFVVATVLLDAIGFGIVLPVLPQLVMHLGGVDLAQATRIGGWLAVCYAGMQFLCGPLMGNIGDRFGRRPVLLGSVAGLAIDFALMGFAPSLAWLFVGRLLAGFFGASYGPASSAMADITPPEERARRFGLISAAFGVGFIVGPAIGGLLGGVSPRAPFLAAAVLSGANFLFGLFFFPETLVDAERRPFSPARANPLGALAALRLLPGVLPLAFVYFFWQLAMMVYPATWAFYAIARFGWPPSTIGASLAFTGVMMASIQMLLLGPIIARIGDRNAVLLGMASATAAFVGYAIVDRTWMVFALMLVTALQSLAQPALNAMMSSRVESGRQGELQGFNGSLAALAALLAPLLLNMPLAYFTSPQAPFRFAGAAFVVAAAMVLVALVALARIPRRGPAPAPAA